MQIMSEHGKTFIIIDEFLEADVKRARVFLKFLLLDVKDDDSIEVIKEHLAILTTPDGEVH